MVNGLPVAQLSALEREALKRAIGLVKPEARKNALMRQVDEICVTRRTEKTAGYYVDFKIPVRLQLKDLTDDFNKTPPQSEARHPDGENAIFFVVYVKEGVLSFMEAASTCDWPVNEDNIVFVG